MSVAAPIKMEVGDSEMSSSNASSSKTLLAAKGTACSLSVALHPLVVLHISDHWTRARAQNNNSAVDIIGALLGRQNGRDVELVNAYECPYDIINGERVVNMELLNIREQQYKEVFPELDLVGWYVTGVELLPSTIDLHVHKKISIAHESQIQTPLVLLKMAPQTRVLDKLPLVVYESVYDMSAGEGLNAEPTIQFVPVPHTIATLQVERIGVEHVARAQTNVQTTSSAKETAKSASDTAPTQLQFTSLSAMSGGITMLCARVRLITAYIRDVDMGKLPYNHDLMRRVNALTTLITVNQRSEQSNADVQMDDDVQLLAVLGTLTKTSATLSSCVERVNVLHDRSVTTSTTLRDPRAQIFGGGTRTQGRLRRQMGL